MTMEQYEQIENMVLTEEIYRLYDDRKLDFEDMRTYICVEDLQGDDWYVGIYGDTDYWIHKALEWCDVDNDSFNAKLLIWLFDNAKSQEEIIESICDIWLLDIDRIYLV